METAVTKSMEALKLIGELNASLHQNFHQLITSLAGARLNGQASNAPLLLDNAAEGRDKRNGRKGKGAMSARSPWEHPANAEGNKNEKS